MGQSRHNILRPREKMCRAPLVQTMLGSARQTECFWATFDGTKCATVSPRCAAGVGELVLILRTSLLCEGNLPGQMATGVTARDVDVASFESDLPAARPNLPKTLEG